MVEKTGNLGGNSILRPEVNEIILELKQAQSQVESLLSKKFITSNLKQYFDNFERLLRKASAMEDFNSQLSSEEKLKLRAVLSEAIVIFTKYQQRTGYTRNKSKPQTTLFSRLLNYLKIS